jgi:hypothetical protein
MRLLLMPSNIRPMVRSESATSFAADMLNDMVLPFYETHGLPVLRIPTDRGTEYCDKSEQHDYHLFWRLTISITPKPRSNHHRQTTSVNGSIK